MLAGDYHGTINPATFTSMQQYQLPGYQHVITARNKRNPQDMVALRLRIGRIGYSQWLNELYVYLLPNFRHDHILPLLGYDKRILDETNEGCFNSLILNRTSHEDQLWRGRAAVPYDSMSNSSSTMDDYDVHGILRRRKSSQRKSTSPNRRATIEYWIVNSYANCITLRHYLMMHALTWGEMIIIAKGIARGVNFLHDMAEYTQTSSLDIESAVDGYIRATRGAIKKAAFKDSAGVLHLKPPLAITIIHRNLSSLNIVLGPGGRPMIWNFGCAYVYHPFQPINFDHYVDDPIKMIHMTSPYSPPEVLSERTYFTYQALKSHDIYSLGMIFYEMLTRCSLPPIEGLTPSENLERTDPLQYRIPWVREFGDLRQVTPEMLVHAVCRHRTRPGMRRCWMVGKRSNRFVQLIRELWDHDYEARLNSCTVIDRLERTKTTPSDHLNRYPISTDRTFDLRTMWPPDDECHQAPMGAIMKESNLCHEPLLDREIAKARRDNKQVSSSEFLASVSAGQPAVIDLAQLQRQQQQHQHQQQQQQQQQPLPPTHPKPPNGHSHLDSDSSGIVGKSFATPINGRATTQTQGISMTTRISPIKVPVYLQR